MTAMTSSMQVTGRRQSGKFWLRRKTSNESQVDELDRSHRKSIFSEPGGDSTDSKFTVKTDDSDDINSSHLGFDHERKDNEISPIIPEVKEPITAIEEDEKEEPKASIESIPSKKHVRFSDVQVHEHPICLGDNPGGYRGVPISISWERCNTTCHSVVDFEKRPRRQQLHQIRMEPLDRVLALKRMGYSGQEIKEGAAAANRIRMARQKTRDYLRLTPMFEYQEAVKRALLNSTIRKPEKRQERELLEPYKKKSLNPYPNGTRRNGIPLDVLNDSIAHYSYLKRQSS